MKKIWLLALVLCVGISTFGCSTIYAQEAPSIQELQSKIDKTALAFNAQEGWGGIMPISGITHLNFINGRGQQLDLYWQLARVAYIDLNKYEQTEIGNIYGVMPAGTIIVGTDGSCQVVLGSIIDITNYGNSVFCRIARLQLK
ncbi:MAG: hypothetical protein LBM93_15200 [Oscillospiraceae bacterium]|jgi:uncharacterized protein YceK|nr:hypothetical protein [Oscillospiraceae bacterium]